MCGGVRLGADVLEAMHSAQGVCGLWMLAGLCEVRVGLPVHVYLCEDTTTHNAITSHTHPFPRRAGLGSQAEAQRREGDASLRERGSAGEGSDSRADNASQPASPPAPRKDVPGAPVATRCLPLRLVASKRGRGSAGDKEARETQDACGL